MLGLTVYFDAPRSDGGSGGRPAGGPTSSPQPSDVAGPASDLTVPPASTVARSVSAPVDDRRELRFDLVTDATRATVRSVDLADRLYVITTSDGSAVPRVENRDSGLDLRLSRTGQPGANSAEIQLNSRVRWTVRLTGAAAEQLVDMSAGGLAGIDFVGGASRIVLSLPTPEGTLPVRMTGGASEFVVHAPRGVPIRVRIGSGAASTTIDTAASSNVAPGTVFTPAGWDDASARYDIDAAAPLSAMRLDRV
jgi:hypothetical protein